MQSLAQGWLVWRLSHDAFLLGVVGAVSQIPSLLFGSIGGVIVDRTVKRKVLFITQAGMALSALLLAIVTYTNIVTVEYVLIIATISGIFGAIDAPARQAFIHDLVGRDDLGNAVALNATTFNGARLIGPSIAGLMVPIIGEAGCFTFNALSYCALIVTLTMMTNLPEPITTQRKPIGHEWKEAFSYIRKTPLPRALILNTIVYSAFGFAYTVLMPVFADKILDVGVRGMGMLMGAVGAGALIGGVWMASFPTGSKRGMMVIFGAMGFAIGAIGFSLSTYVPLSLLLLAMIGFSSITMLSSTNTLLQMHAPDQLRGRVLGFYTTSFMGTAPIGNFLVGVLAAKIGSQWALTSISVFCLVIALQTVVVNKHVRAV